MKHFSLSAGSVLRMMQVALGVSTWTKGLKNYLDGREFNYATSSDLYAGLQASVNADYPDDPPNVTEIFQTWETQSGYPLVTVTRSGQDVLTFTQERFYYDEETSDSLWWIPISYAVGSSSNFEEAQPDFWMQKQKTSILRSTESDAPKSWTADDWIVVNIQESGYYRVNYDAELWQLLIKQLNGVDFDKIHLLNRAQLVDDSLNLARAGKIGYEIPFAVLEYLMKEEDYIPWASVICEAF